MGSPHKVGPPNNVGPKVRAGPFRPMRFLNLVYAKVVPTSQSGSQILHYILRRRGSEWESSLQSENPKKIFISVVIRSWISCFGFLFQYQKREMHLWPSLRIRESFKFDYLKKLEWNLKRMENESPTSKKKLLNSEEAGSTERPGILACCKDLLIVVSCCCCCFCCGGNPSSLLFLVKIYSISLFSHMGVSYIWFWFVWVCVFIWCQILCKGRLRKSQNSKNSCPPEFIGWIRV